MAEQAQFASSSALAPANGTVMECDDAVEDLDLVVSGLLVPSDGVVYHTHALQVRHEVFAVCFCVIFVTATPPISGYFVFLSLVCLHV